MALDLQSPEKWNKLRSLRDELSSIDPTNWEAIRLWRMKIRPLVSDSFSQQLPDFDRTSTSPTWERRPIHLGPTPRREFLDQEAQEIEQLNRTRSTRKHADILAFLDGLLLLDDFGSRTKQPTREFGEQAEVCSSVLGEIARLFSAGEELHRFAVRSDKELANWIEQKGAWLGMVEGQLRTYSVPAFHLFHNVASNWEGATNPRAFDARHNDGLVQLRCCLDWLRGFLEKEMHRSTRLS